MANLLNFSLEQQTTCGEAIHTRAKTTAVVPALAILAYQVTTTLVKHMGRGQILPF